MERKTAEQMENDESIAFTIASQLAGCKHKGHDFGAGGTDTREMYRCLELQKKHVITK